MDNLLRANLVGVWLCAEARVAVYREGSGYRVQLGVLDEKTGAWENDEQDEVFPDAYRRARICVAGGV